ALVAALIFVGSATPSFATDLPLRTLMLSNALSGAPSDGASADPVIDTDNSTIVFDSTATDLVANDPNGPIRDIFSLNLATGARHLLSLAPDGSGADGPSYSPSAGGGSVAFVTDADNLFPNDTNGASDVMALRPDGKLVLVSAAADGTPGNGASSQPQVTEN